jgi:hypothetical protein
MSDTLADFRGGIEKLGDKQLKALFLLYKEQQSPGVNDITRKDCIEAELYKRKVVL